MKTMKQLAAEAIMVQNACNPLGLSKSFGEVVLNLRALLEEQKIYGHDAITGHPIFKLWVSKLHDMGGMGISDMGRYDWAYTECQKLAQ